MTAPAGWPSKPRRWHAIVLAVKLTLLALVCYFVGRELLRRFAEVDWAHFDPQPGWLVLAATAMAAAWGLFAVSFRLLLGGLTDRVPPWSLMPGIAFTPQLGKYVPGKIASIAGAVWLLRRCGLRGAAATAGILLQTGLGTALGLLTAVPLTLWPPVANRLPGAWLWCGLLVAAGLTLLHPRVFEALLNRALRLAGREPLTLLPRLGRYFQAAGVLLGHWALMGLALFLACRAFADVPLGWLPVLIAAAGLSATVGFLALFAPAGLGVREAILLVVLSGVLSETDAALVTVAMRLLSILVEVGLGLAGLVSLRALPPADSPASAG